MEIIKDNSRKRMANIEYKSTRPTVTIKNNTINTMDTTTDVDNKDATINATIASIGNLSSVNLSNLVGWTNTSTSTSTTSENVTINTGTLIINNPGNGKDQIYFDADRAFAIRQASSGSSTMLEFAALNDSKKIVFTGYWGTATNPVLSLFMNGAAGNQIQLLTTNGTVGVANANTSGLYGVLDVNGSAKIRGSTQLDGSVLASGYLNSAGFVNVMNTARLIFQNSTPTTISQMYLSGNNLKITTIENGTIDLLTANGSVRINQANATPYTFDVNGTSMFRGITSVSGELISSYMLSIRSASKLDFFNSSYSTVSRINYDGTNLVISPRFGGTYADLKISNTDVNMTNTSLYVGGSVYVNGSTGINGNMTTLQGTANSCTSKYLNGMIISTNCTTT